MYEIMNINYGSSFSYIFTLVSFPVTLSFCHTVYGCVIRDAWLFLCLYHVCKSSIEGVGVSIHFGFAVSGTVLFMYWCDNNLVQECGIQLIVQYGKSLHSMVRAVFLVFYFFKVSRVLTQSTFLSGIMIIEKLCIIQLAFVPIFFVCV